MLKGSLEHVGHVRHEGQVAATLDGLTHFTLVLQAGAGEAAGKDLALLVHEAHQEVLVLVVDVGDPHLLETTVLLLRRLDGDRREVADLAVVLCGHGLGVAGFCGLLLRGLVAALLGEGDMVLVHRNGEEPDHALIAAVFGLELGHERRLAFELDQVVEARGLLLDGIRELAHPPALFMADLATACFDQVFELLYRLLCLVPFPTEHVT